MVINKLAIFLPIFVAFIAASIAMVVAKFAISSYMRAKREEDRVLRMAHLTALRAIERKAADEAAIATKEHRSRLSLGQAQAQFAAKMAVSESVRKGVTKAERRWKRKQKAAAEPLMPVVPPVSGTARISTADVEAAEKVVAAMIASMAEAPVAPVVQVEAPAALEAVTAPVDPTHEWPDEPVASAAA